MPTVVLDSNVLIASHNDGADNHEVSKDIVRGIDRGVLPRARVAYMQRHHIEYIYSFDDDFDALDSVTRLQTDTNPFGW